MSRQTLLALSLSAFALTACQTNEPAPIENEPAPQAATQNDNSGTTDTLERVAESRREVAEQTVAVEDGVNPARELPRLQGQLQSEGYGLSMIIDGSSPQAFADSLDAIAADTSPAQFRRLDSSIRFLEAYALGVDNLAQFYQTLDGQTAEEIIERAQGFNRQR